MFKTIQHKIENKVNFIKVKVKENYYIINFYNTNLSFRLGLHRIH